MESKFKDCGKINIDDGSNGGTHWVAFYTTVYKNFYFDSFGGPPIEKLTKPIHFSDNILQDKERSLCAPYCLYFLYLMNQNIL